MTIESWSQSPIYHSFCNQSRLQKSKEGMIERDGCLGKMSGQLVGADLVERLGPKLSKARLAGESWLEWSLVMDSGAPASRLI